MSINEKISDALVTKHYKRWRDEGNKESFDILKERFGLGDFDESPDGNWNR